MYAVFEDGSRQYRVSAGQTVEVDYRDAAVGSRVEFPRVLLYQDGDDTRIGQPAVEGVRVVAEVVGQPSKKYYIQKYRRRKNYRRLTGHRQHFLAVRVLHILLPGQEAPPPEAPPPEAPPPEAPTSEVPAPEAPAPETPPSETPSSEAPPSEAPAPESSEPQASEGGAPETNPPAGT
jgi:large subunit ribosomal protein L21